jgi:SAM-dependent methyltransferase
MTDATDAQLAAQYEAYPYPKRDPKDEAKRLISGTPSHLREIDHWVFGAVRPRSRPLSALIAGGGTGDGAIMLAQLLATDGRPGRVTYLDRSAAAHEVARSRAQARGLALDWVRLSLLDLPGSGLGPFDYIDCCGVLHHLPDPAAGLRALLSVLAPGGGLGLMVYAPHGRTGVYMLQDALRLLAPDTEPPPTRLDVARRVMRNLPDTAWLRANRNFGDHIDGGDAGLYDLLLNPRDRAYTVSDFAALLHAEGLRVTAWMEPMRYDPAAFLPDPKLRARIANLDPLARAALAEALAGNMSKHVVYCVRDSEAPPEPDPTQPGAIPITRDTSGPELARSIRRDGTIIIGFDALRVPVALPPLAGPILNLIDGQRSVGEIVASVQGKRADTDATVKAWRQTFEPLSRVNKVLLAPPP